MPTTSIENDVLPRDTIPQDALAKEFGGYAGMDDSDAYLERGAADALDDGSEAQDVTDWRAAKSLKQLQTQVNQTFPNRKKSSDGMIGDTAHCPGTSDHCPNIVDGGIGVVTGYDITHDPANGCDMAKVTNAVIASRDSRIKYIIYDSRICSSYEHNGVAAWTWRAYSGPNPHTKHAHFSVLAEKSKYDDTSSWTITGGGSS